MEHQARGPAWAWRRHARVVTAIPRLRLAVLIVSIAITAISTIGGYAYDRSLPEADARLTALTTQTLGLDDRLAVGFHDVARLRRQAVRLVSLAVDQVDATRDLEHRFLGQLIVDDGMRAATERLQRSAASFVISDGNELELGVAELRADLREAQVAAERASAALRRLSDAVGLLMMAVPVALVTLAGTVVMLLFRTGRRVGEAQQAIVGLKGALEDLQRSEERFRS